MYTSQSNWTVFGNRHFSEQKGSNLKKKHIKPSRIKKGGQSAYQINKNISQDLRRIY